MVVTPVPHTCNEQEAKKLWKIAYRIEYVWLYTPKYQNPNLLNEDTGTGAFYVTDRMDGVAVINYWNIKSEYWKYTMKSTDKVEGCG